MTDRNPDYHCYICKKYLHSGYAGEDDSHIDIETLRCSRCSALNIQPPPKPQDPEKWVITTDWFVVKESELEKLCKAPGARMWFISTKRYDSKEAAEQEAKKRLEHLLDQAYRQVAACQNALGRFQ